MHFACAVVVFPPDWSCPLCIFRVRVNSSHPFFVEQQNKTARWPEIRQVHFHPGDVWDKNTVIGRNDDWNSPGVSAEKLQRNVGECVQNRPHYPVGAVAGPAETAAKSQAQPDSRAERD